MFRFSHKLWIIKKKQPRLSAVFGATTRRSSGDVKTVQLSGKELRPFTFVQSSSVYQGFYILLSFLLRYNFVKQNLQHQKLS